MRLLTLLGTAASVLVTVSATIAYADFDVDENILPPGPFKRCQACGGMGRHKREVAFILATTLAVSAIEDTNTVLDGVTRSKHYGGPHYEYQTSKIMTILPYPCSKWILPIGVHYKREAVDANDEADEAAKWIKGIPPGAHM
ncbi:hypothetical protein BG006_003175 [Podila minutissima]|uniref:Uncharacterized protein n=1 Tax=Podila minutissima TaxID=64525 RepID=A0A9P5SB77_9FUNG|nr:hypothetical protein BG006_003175 [Podila minutissima]